MAADRKSQGTESLLDAPTLYSQGRVVEAARKEADACDRDGYGITASMLRDLADAVEACDMAINWHDPRIVPTADVPTHDAALRLAKEALQDVTS